MARVHLLHEQFCSRPGCLLERQEAGGRRQEAGGRRQEAGGRRQKGGGRIEGGVHLY